MVIDPRDTKNNTRTFLTRALFSLSLGVTTIFAWPTQHKHCEGRIAMYINFFFIFSRISLNKYGFVITCVHIFL